jgi:hypothetical protein
MYFAFVGEKNGKVMILVKMGLPQNVFVALCCPSTLIELLDDK